MERYPSGWRGRFAKSLGAKAREGSNPSLSARSSWYTGRVSELNKRKPNVSCVVCKKQIYRRPVEIQRNGGRIFCSMVCYGLSNRKEQPCLVCGKAILAGLNKKTCSRACSNKHRTGIRYNMHRPKDKVVSQRALKVRLLQERGAICERCGYQKRQILQVHHKDRNRLNNALDNLELICPNCHCEEHYLEKVS